MKNIEIEKFIEELRSKNNYQEAYIGFFQYGGGPDESLIRANPQGLKLYAADILEAAFSEHSKIENPKHEAYALDLDYYDDNSEYFFEYVEVTEKTRNQIIPKSLHKEGWFDKFVFISLIAIILLIIFLFFLGLYTAFKWLF